MRRTRIGLFVFGLFSILIGSPALAGNSGNGPSEETRTLDQHLEGNEAAMDRHETSRTPTTRPASSEGDSAQKIELTERQREKAEELDMTVEQYKGVLAYQRHRRETEESSLSETKSSEEQLDWQERDALEKARELSSHNELVVSEIDRTEITGSSTSGDVHDIDLEIVLRTPEGLQVAKLTPSQHDKYFVRWEGLRLAEHVNLKLLDEHVGIGHSPSEWLKPTMADDASSPYSRR